jgi:NADH-quinone oxidoreductase subunit J
MLKLFFSIGIASFILGSLSLLVLMLNTIHSLLLLIEIFIFGAFLLFFFNVEFLGLIFLMIYLGAILVLFLFVVMMLDIKTSSVQNDDLKSFVFKGIGI